MTVYIDLLFIVNLIMNALVLAGSQILAGHRLRRGRLAAGAAIGALYSVMIFFPKTGFLLQWGLRALVGAVMVLVASPFGSWRRLGRSLLCFYVCLGIFGGGMYLFYAFTPVGAEMVYSGGVYYIDLPLWLLLALSFGFYALIRLVVFFQNRRQRDETLCEVEICCKGRYRSLRALVDTGNHLQDPMTLAPVVIVEAAALAGVLPEELLAAVRQGLGAAPDRLLQRFADYKCRLIPFRGVGDSGGVMAAVRPDWIRRLPDGERLDNVVLALSDHPLSEAGTYQVLLQGGMNR